MTGSRPKSAEQAPVHVEASEVERDLLLADPELLADFKSGVPSALSKVIRHYAPVAAATIGRIVHDPIEAQDILQDTLERLLNSRGQYRGNGPYRAFVRTVARNQAITAHRKRRRIRADPLPDDVVDSNMSSEDAALEQEAELERQSHLRELGEFRDSLSEDDQELLDLHYGEDMGRPRLARKLGLGEKTVRNRLQRLLGKVNDWLSRRSGG